MELGDEFFETDVLVVGAGGAGAMAAIEAHKRKVEVMVVAKGELPSGCTSVAMGAMQVAYNLRDSPEIHFKDTIVGGAYMNNQRLVRVMVDESSDRVHDLEEFGTEFRKENGRYKLFPISGCTYPRAVVARAPYEGGFIEGLLKEIKRRGIEIFENVMATNLIKRNGTVVGVTGVNLQTGEFLVFSAKSTVLATGGSGQLYPVTTNPADVSGDGFAMAYRAGAELMDMEFIQLRACIVHPPALRGEPPPLDGLVTIGGRFYNALGERYMKRYYPTRAENVTRDAIAICTHKEIKAGRGTVHGGVYNDLSGVPEEELRHFRKFLEACRAEDIDPRWQPIEWGPGVHHFMGGVRINEKCETNIPGLFAAGEVTGGIHGANRIGGNALTDVMVFGARAGRFAAERAFSINAPKIDNTQVDVERDRVFKTYERKDGIDVHKLRRNIQTITQNYLGVVRNANELKEAVSELKRIKKDEAPIIYLPGEGTYKQLGTALEVENYVDIGLMVARAALMRTESRGAHYREDYLRRDDKRWLKNIVIRFEAGEMRLYTTPIMITELKPV